MLKNKTALTLAASAAVAVTTGFVAAASAHQPEEQVDISTIPAGMYELDPAHGKITWSVSHLGFSTYKGQFPAVEATLSLDPSSLDTARVEASIDLTEQGTLNPALDEHLKSADFFDVANHPSARFETDKVTLLGEDRALIDGHLTLRGVTKPVRFTAEFNKAGVNPIDQRYSLGFDGQATIRRSKFGVDYGLPMVSDEVNLHLEGEFKLAENQ